MAVVQLHARRTGIELIREATAWIDDLEDAVHLRRMDPVEVDRVRVRAAVEEVHPQPVALGGADHRAWRGAVVHPRLEEHAGSDLELRVRCGERVLANATRLIGQCRRRVQKRIEIGWPADGRSLVADHGRVPHRTVEVVRRHPLVAVRPHVVVSGRRRARVERELSDERDGRKRRRGCEQLPPGESCFSHD